MYRGSAYKYRGFGKFDAEVKQRIEQMLIGRECYFAKPSSLNDPYDCKPNLKLIAKDLRAYITKLSKKNGYRLKSTEITKTVIDIQSDYGGSKFQKLLDSMISVFCLSQYSTLSTQWAYYGDNHQGYCIEYELGSDFGHPSVSIDYRKNRPEIDLIRFQKEASYRYEKLKELATTKSMYWSHENEIRVLGRKSGAYKVPQENIKSVIFGINASSKHIDYIKSLVTSHGLNIKLFRCIENEQDYSLKADQFF